MTARNLANGGRILVDQLVAEGVDRIFGVPGESYLAVLDALYDTPAITYHLCRQEGGAAMMADAYGKLTGRPGICFVTRGPGATNASAGVLELLRGIARSEGVAVVCSLHQVPFARAYADRIIGLSRGRVVTDVPIGEFDEAAFTRLYGSHANGANHAPPASEEPA